MQRQRNDLLFDLWSVVHFTTGVIFAWIMPPFVALSIMVLWEPLENLVLSPLLAKVNINFGYETIRNSLSDIFFDVLGVAIGYYLLGHFFSPPFILF